MEDYHRTLEFHVPSCEDATPPEAASPKAPSALTAEPTQVQAEFDGKSGGAESETAQLHKLVKRVMLLPTATVLATASLFLASAGVDPLKDDFLSKDNYWEEAAPQISLLDEESVLLQGEADGSRGQDGDSMGQGSSQGTDGSENLGENGPEGAQPDDQGSDLFVELDPAESDAEVYVHSMKDAREYLSQGIHRLNLVGDFVIDLNVDMLAGAEFVCHGYRMTVIGTWRDFQTYGDSIMGIEIRDASYVDLSGMSIDIDSFDHTQNPDMIYSVISVNDENLSHIAMPAGYVTREQKAPNVAPYDAFCCYETGIGGQVHTNICYVSPSTTYEARQKLETECVRAILTRGSCHDLIDLGESNDLPLYTNLSVNLGNSVLPGTNVMFMSLRNGASLTLSGTLTVTGNSTECTPRISVNSGSSLDISGLTLINEHPYADMFIVDVEAGANTSGLNPKAGAGTLRVDHNGNSVIFCID
ncbi:MAG: hypothetical protein K6F31_05410 [Acetatifactor sp.]|nr:hypothetical protein [Acetatifactor sp.]